jgi:phosphomannomutase
MNSEQQLIQTAQAWVAQDFDPATISELKELISNVPNNPVALAELASRFAGPLQFGTAGLRAEVAAGESRMNRATVAKAAWGVSSWLLANQKKVLLVGNDARNGSVDFAEDTCGIAAALGLSVIRLAGPVPTPVLAYALTELKADAAIMVTASHNPAKDNGYKVYDHSGSQIISPSDKEIAALIAKAPAAKDIDRSGNYQTVEMIDKYVSYVTENALPGLNKDLKIAYTALHGVGSITFNKLLTEVGYQNLVEVKAQQQPDPAFPTVDFPNPEEDGAMDLLLELAEAENADIAIANDPDADRTAIALPTRTGWHRLSGDELGTLLAWWCVKRANLQNKPATGAMAASIVSSSMIKRIATANQLDFSFTLTGFKYVGRVTNLKFGYEEAIGYCVLPEKIKDKDGISASLFAIELVSYLKSNNKSALQQLDELYQSYGTVLTKQITLRLTDVAAVGAKLAEIMSNLPTALGDTKLTNIADFSSGIDGLPKASGIRLSFANGRIIIRPSGTEPKLKCYIEVTAEPDHDLAAQKAKLSRQLDLLADELAKLVKA